MTSSIGPGPAGKPPMRSLASVFYAGFAGIALLWGALAGRPVFWRETPPTLESVLTWGAAGVLFGLAIALLTYLTLDRVAWMRRLGGVLGEALGPLRWWDAVLLAALSGVAEEMLFRGAMQPTLGLVPTSVLFALVHWPATRALIPWTLSAGALGLAFGWAAEASGHLAGPIAAHFVVNVINLKRLSDFARQR